MDQEGFLTNLETIENEKDLGVWTSNTLNPLNSVFRRQLKPDQSFDQSKTVSPSLTRKHSVLFKCDPTLSIVSRLGPPTTRKIFNIWNEFSAEQEVGAWARAETILR
jgi:hypothetical protein